MSLKSGAIERTARLIWDWAKGPPPNRPGETTITVMVAHGSNDTAYPYRFYQAQRTTCPFCGRTVILAATGQDPNLRQRYYYEAHGRKHVWECTNPEEARKGVRLAPRAVL